MDLSRKRIKEPHKDHKRLDIHTDQAHVINFFYDDLVPFVYDFSTKFVSLSCPNLEAFLSWDPKKTLQDVIKSFPTGGKKSSHLLREKISKCLGDGHDLIFATVVRCV